MRVGQLLCAAGPVDAVTNQALAYRGLFERWGWGGADFAPVRAHDMDRKLIRSIGELDPTDYELLVIHYSGYAPELGPVLTGARRTVLISHNITPPSFFWATDPMEAVRCRLARRQLAELAQSVGSLAAVSEFNAAELRELSGRDVEVIPVLVDRPPPAQAPALKGPPTILFVGRLVPHKRQDLIIRAFARLRRSEPDAQLWFVGTPLSPDYLVGLRRLADELAPGAVRFEAGLSPAELWDRYRMASLFLCLSEHEGFCIPLLEALHFGLPVIARDAGAVPEVIGDAGILVGVDDGPQTIAELIRIVLGDGELRDELGRRGESRLEHFAYARVAARVKDALTELVAA
jgi:glycosyltransferase involved in cell wall biosynthesis